MKFCNIQNKFISRLHRGPSVLLGMLLAVLISHPALAQTFAGSIAGTVTDATGAVVAGAQLQLENTVINDVRAQTSTEHGGYLFTNLLPGTYKISVTAGGFKAFVRSEMILPASTAAVVNIQLEVGGTQETVTVSAGRAVLVDTASASTSITIDSQMLQSLPNNTLQPLNFVFNLAGTTESVANYMSTRSGTVDQNTSTFGLNGGRTAEALILVDGASSTAIDWGGMMVSPIQDSVQEQQIVQNVYDAQYQRGGSGVVTLVTRGGSNDFHGEVYDFMRNNGFDANSWSNKFYGGSRGKFHRNQFGGNIGGPILKSQHLYFFGAYEALRQPGTWGFVATVPSEAERTGDFSNSLDPNGKPLVIYNPFSTHLVTDSQGKSYYTRDPFPGNKIPAALIDKTGQAIANLYGKPTQAGDNGTNANNFFKQAGDESSNDKFDWRIDWAQSEKHRLFARMSDRVRQNYTPPCFFCTGEEPANGTYAIAEGANRGVQVVLNDTISPNSKWVFDTYGAFTRWFEGQTQVGYGKSDPSMIGLPADLFQIRMLPVVRASGYSQMGAEYSSYDRYVRYLSTGIINITRQFTRHTVKFGFNYDVSMINHRENAPGIFDFSGQMSGCDPHLNELGEVDGACEATIGSGTSGSAIADMLLGTGSGSTKIFMDPAMSAHAFGMYGQDDWRVTPKLTLSAGLRYENQRPATERHNRIALFNTNAVNPISTAYGSTLRGAFEYAGVNGRGRNAWEADNKNFGPRLGAAYRFTDKLVGRLGGGIFYGPASAMLSFDREGQSPGYNSLTNWVGSQDSNGYIPTNLVSNPFPNGINQPTGNAEDGSTFVGFNVSQMWPKQSHPTGIMYQWSSDLQYQVLPHAVFEIGYTGVRGRHLMYGNPNLDFDQLPTSQLALGSKLDDLVDNPFYGIVDPGSAIGGEQVPYHRLLRPYPEFTQLQATRSFGGANSQFDAMNAEFNYSFHNGLTSITTFQWSKALDNGSEALLGWTVGGSWRDSYNTKLDYGLSTHDRPTSFAEMWVYQLPYGTGRRFGATAPLPVRLIAGGWNVSGVIRLASGYPLFTPVALGWNPLSNYGFPGDGLPNLVGNPKPKHRDKDHWFNNDAFQGLSSSGDGSLVSCGQDANCQPFNYQYGNEPQHYSSLREAATKNLDLGIGKEFRFERVRAEFRTDFLNAFNHPIYGGAWNINSHFGWGADVGQVTGTRNDPRNIQMALKVSF